MKYLLLLMIFFIINGFSADREPIKLYSTYTDNEIKLKWITSEYQPKSLYFIYRSSAKEGEHLVATVEPFSSERLHSIGYDKEYIEFVHPYLSVKTLDDKIELAKYSKNIHGFRIMKMMEDSQFALHIGHYWSDKNISKGVKYRYRIEQRPNAKVSNTSIVTVRSALKPQSPIKWMKLHQSARGIDIVWEVDKEGAFYTIHRKLNEKETIISKKPIYYTLKTVEGKESLFEDNSLNENEKATYYISKVDIFGDVVGISKKIEVVRKIDKRPKIVTGIFSKAEERHIELRWSGTESNLTYNVYRSATYQNGYQKLTKKPITGNVYFDNNFTVGKEYYYCITAINPYGESAKSLPILGYARDTTPPKRIDRLNVTVTPGEARFSWKPIQDNGLKGYRIYRSMDKNAHHWELLNNEPIKESSYILKQSKILSRYPYYFYVTSLDTLFHESAPSEIVEVKFPDVISPSEPKIKQTVGYTNKIFLEWYPVYEYDVSHYNVYKRTSNGIKKLNLKPITELVYEDINVTTMENKYIITAVDTTGNESLKENLISVKSVDNHPVNIKNLQLTKGIKGSTVAFSCSDNDYSGFELYRAIGNGDFVNISGFTKDKTYTDKAVFGEGQKVYYRLKIYDLSGNIVETKTLKR